MLVTIGFVLISCLLFGYSFLRYGYLWSRGRIPQWVYYVFQAFLLGTLFVCFFFSNLLQNSVLIYMISFVGICYMSVMLITPVFCFVRGAIRMLGKRLQWKNRLYRFFNHPTKINWIAMWVAISAGIALFIFIRFPLVEMESVAVKKESTASSFSVATISDLRLGQFTTPGDVERIFERLREIKPEVTVFLGNSYGRRDNEQYDSFFLQQLKEISSDTSVYLIEGEIESTRKQRQLQQLQEEGIQVLRDDTIHMENGFQLVGCRSREDEKRKELSFTCSFIDKKKPTIVFSAEELDEKEKQMVSPDSLLCAEAYDKCFFLPRKIRVITYSFQ